MECAVIVGVFRAGPADSWRDNQFMVQDTLPVRHGLHVRLWGTWLAPPYLPNLPHSAESFHIWSVHSVFLIHLEILQNHPFFGMSIDSLPTKWMLHQSLLSPLKDDLWANSHNYIICKPSQWTETFRIYTLGDSSRVRGRSPPGWSNVWSCHQDILQ